MKKLIIILLFNVAFVAKSQLTFTLSGRASTSAGVYNNYGTLLRTLWSDSIIAAGTYPVIWDGKDDYGNTVLLPGVTSIKVLSNNVFYHWDGIIGNTSFYQTGSGVHRGYYTSMTGMAISGTTAYFCQGYSEAYSSEAKFDINNPQVRLDLSAPFRGAKTTMNSDFVATDGSHVYWAGYDFYNPAASSLVHATVVGSDAEYLFSSGSSYKINFGKPMTYASVVDKLSGGASAHPSGLAVQASGNYLFVAHAGLNQLHILNKLTGALVQNLSFTAPRYLSIEGNYLWMVSGTNTISKYQMNSDGTLSSAILSLSGITLPGALQANGSGTITIVDQTNQVLRFFNTSTGIEAAQLGVNGGYANSPDVTNTKYFFNDFRGNKFSFIAYAPDGSFWFGDPGNFRELHFTSGKTYIDYIMSMGIPYSTCVDPNNIARVFGNYLEFAVDYSQALTGHSGWTLVKNWGYAHDQFTNPNSTKRLLNVMTLSNGRTYGYDYNTGAGLVELTSTGLRVTGVTIGNGVMNTDGSLTKFSGRYDTGSSVVYTRYALTNFDASNNPVWASTGTLLGKTPPNTLKNPNNFPGNVSPVSYNNVTASGKLISYNPSIFYGGTTLLYDGYHLGAMNLHDSNWLWKTERANSRSYTGNYPPVDIFEIGNSVNQNAGSNVNVSGNNIITGHHDENWKNGQTNRYKHFWENGLAVGAFGTDYYTISGIINVYPLPDTGMAGNALSPSLVAADANNMYLYHGDESIHGGIHRWKISGLNTIQEQTASAPINILPVANAGTDKAITLPVNNITLSGSGSDADGTVTAYWWSKVSGPVSGTITTAALANTTVTGFSIAGTYVYRLTVTDNDGATSSDDVTVIVSPVIPPPPPTRKMIPVAADGGIYFLNNGYLQPGDTGCIAAGVYPYISMSGVIGTASQPIIIMNCGGQVICGSGPSYAYRIVNSQYFRFTGTGTPGIEYGFKAWWAGGFVGSGMNIKDSTSDYEVDHYEAQNVDNGFLCKIDPADCDPGTWSNGWSINNISIHDNYVHNTIGEGYYLVNTSQTKIVKNCSGADTTVEAVKANNYKVYNNIADSTGWDGIQLASATNTDMYNNRVTNYGRQKLSSQQAGIILGAKSDGKVHDNYINNGTGEGLEIFSKGHVDIYNNQIIDAGHDGTSEGQDGLAIDDRPEPSGTNAGLQVYVINNTIVNAGRNAIHLYNSYGTMASGNKVYNNFLVKPNNPSIYDNPYLNMGAGVVVDTLNNVKVPLIANAFFVDTSSNNYHLSATSPAVNAGLNVITYGITKDYDGLLRKQPFDAGAFGFYGILPIIPSVEFIVTHGKIIFK